MFVPIVCVCFKKCHNFVPELKQRELNSKLYELKSYDLQSALLFGLIKVLEKKKNLHKKCR